MLKWADVVPIWQTWSVRYSHGKCQVIAQLHNASIDLINKNSLSSTSLVEDGGGGGGPHNVRYVYMWNNGLLVSGAHTDSGMGYATMPTVA